jgi:2-oxoglutarate ferredoxin oxidoreductase subunit alpha
MQEGISYIAGAELPCVLVNIMRAGPGLGGVQPSQADYFQATKGGGHGDYRVIVLAPATLQEAADLTQLAFDLADRYRNPVMLLADGMIGQLMEPVELLPYRPAADLPPKDWATTGTAATGGRRRVINSLYLHPDELERHVRSLYAKYEAVERNEVRYELHRCDDAEVIIVAYGTTARIARSAIDKCRRLGLRSGLLRPITLYPFPFTAFEKVIAQPRSFLVVEMSMGQMLDDVKIAVAGRKPISFYGRTGGIVPTPEEIVNQVRGLAGGGGA